MSTHTIRYHGWHWWHGAGNDRDTAGRRRGVPDWHAVLCWSYQGEGYASAGCWHAPLKQSEMTGGTWGPEILPPDSRAASADKAAESEREAALAVQIAEVTREKDAAMAVLMDPQALWANWLRGTVALPAGIGDVRSLQTAIDQLAHELTGNEGEDDPISVIRNAYLALEAERDSLSMRLERAQTLDPRP